MWHDVLEAELSSPIYELSHNRPWEDAGRPTSQEHIKEQKAPIGSPRAQRSRKWTCCICVCRAPYP